MFFNIIYQYLDFWALGVPTFFALRMSVNNDRAVPILIEKQCTLSAFDTKGHFLINNINNFQQNVNKMPKISQNLTFPNMKKMDNHLCSEIRLYTYKHVSMFLNCCQEFQSFPRRTVLSKIWFIRYSIPARVELFYLNYGLLGILVLPAQNSSL